MAHALNGDFDECMSGLGFSRPWQDSIFPVGGYDHPLSYTLWAARNLDGYYRQMRIEEAQGWRIEQRLNTVEATGDEADAESTCRDQNPAVDEERTRAIRTPKVVEELRNAWSEAMAQVFLAGAPYADYERCITQTGVLERLGANTSEEARTMLATSVPPDLVALDGDPATPEWEEYLEQESEFVGADWECRRDIRAGLGDDVEDALDAFEADNADRIDTARNHWMGIWQDATALGWSPSDPGS
ncbi:hypothetical protein KUV85_06105 [Nocardioides panacisoli]|uniref:hypothetical protein n=1 Tax=Nocardioides panacisoli TaxID=627624 RepID=UPI001C62CCE1|nr:hypothetical protein [Nocardioides panacisoli]QYJ05247.1 hypothetical protein KUV85_06105 [Nocardioides panacisoli]